jgi:hypothetical protein
MPGGPVSGDDAHDLIDDALAKLAMRSGAWLSDDITAMTLITSLIDQAARFLPELVTNARLNGHSWDEIARAIGTSPKKPTCGSTRTPRSPTPDGPTTSKSKRACLDTSLTRRDVEDLRLRCGSRPRRFPGAVP